MIACEERFPVWMVYTRDVWEFVVGAKASCPMEWVSRGQFFDELVAIDVSWFNNSLLTQRKFHLVQDAGLTLIAATFG